jgi:adenylate cyclase class 2
MHIEIEAKFLDLDHDEMRSKLQAVGAVLEQPMRLMRRTIFDYPDHRLQQGERWGRLRVRDEGDKSTITYKSGGEKEYSKEIETTIGSYETMLQLLETIGLVAYSFQESKRETWRLDDVEIVLDIWPWLKPYIEIEGESEKDIREVATSLGLFWENAAFGNVDTAYRRDYPGMASSETVGSISKLTFAGSLPDWLEERSKS